MSERIDKIKTHIKENKKTYIVIGVTGLVTGALGFIYGHRRGVTIASQNVVEMFNLKYKSPTTVAQIFEITIERLGNAGDAILDTATNTIYPSKNAAYLSTGISRTHINEMINAGERFQQLLNGAEPVIMQLVKPE